VIRTAQGDGSDPSQSQWQATRALRSTARPGPRRTAVRRPVDACDHAPPAAAARRPGSALLPRLASRRQDARAVAFRPNLLGRPAEVEADRRSDEHREQPESETVPSGRPTCGILCATTSPRVGGPPVGATTSSFTTAA